MAGRELISEAENPYGQASGGLLSTGGKHGVGLELSAFYAQLEAPRPRFRVLFSHRT